MERVYAGFAKAIDQKKEFEIYDGEDLKVGGEGMKGFYDKMIPNYLNKYGKKWGAKTGVAKIEVNGEDIEVHSFPITSEMKEDIKKNGQPLFKSFEKDEQDSYSFGKNKSGSTMNNKLKKTLNGLLFRFELRKAGISVKQPHHYETIGGKRVRRPGENPNEGTTITRLKSGLLVNVHKHGSDRKKSDTAMLKDKLKAKYRGQWHKVEDSFGDTDWSKSGWVIPHDKEDDLIQDFPDATHYDVDEEKQVESDSKETERKEKLGITSIDLGDGVKYELVDGVGFVKGNTFAYKEVIKKLGGKWSKSEGAWIISKQADEFPDKIKEALEAQNEQDNKGKSNGSDGGDNTASKGSKDSSGRPDKGGKEKVLDKLQGDAKSVKRKEYRIHPDTTVEVVTEDKAKKLSSSTMGGKIRPSNTVKLNAAVAKALLADGGNYQKEDAESILSAFYDPKRNSRGFLYNAGTGTGKTFTTLAVIASQKPKRAIVFVPNQGVLDQWVDAAKLFGIDLQDVSLGKTDGKKGIFIATHGDLRSNAGKTKENWDMTVFDEAHKLSNKNLKPVTDEGFEGMPSQVSQATEVLTGLSDHNLFLTATPYEQIWQMGYLESLGLWDPRGFNKFMKEHGVEDKTEQQSSPGRLGQEKSEYGGKPKMDRTFFVFNGDTNSMLDIFQQMNQKGVCVNRDIRLDKSQVHQFHETGLTDDQWSEIAHCADLFDEYASVSDGYPQIMAQKYDAVRRLAEVYKTKDAINVGKDLLKKGKSVAFFVSRVNMSKLDEPGRKWSPGIKAFMKTIPSPVDLVNDAFGGDKKVANYHGNVTPGVKKKDKEAFNNGTKKVLVASIASGGTGLSLHDTTGKHPRAQINIGLPWSALELSQLAGRTHRMGSKSDSLQVWMHTSVPEEVSLAKTVGTRLKQMGAMTKGIETDAEDAEVLKYMFNAERNNTTKTLMEESKDRKKKR